MEQKSPFEKPNQRYVIGIDPAKEASNETAISEWETGPEGTWKLLWWKSTTIELSPLPESATTATDAAS